MTSNTLSTIFNTHSTLAIIVSDVVLSNFTLNARGMSLKAGEAGLSKGTNVENCEGSEILFLTCKLASYPAVLSWILAEDLRFLDKKLHSLILIVVARESAFSLVP